MKEAKVGKKAEEYSDFKTSKLPQGFYDKVAENKDKKAMSAKEIEAKTAKDDKSSGWVSLYGCVYEVPLSLSVCVCVNLSTCLLYSAEIKTILSDFCLFKVDLFTTLT